MNIGGNILSEEARQKISKAIKGNKHTEEVRQKISKKVNEWYKINMPFNTGKHLSEETKQLLSKIAKNRYSNETHPMYGRHHTEETKQKIRESSNNKGCNNPMFGKTGEFNTQSKNYLIITPNNEKLIIKGINNFCKENNLITTNMIAVSKGKQKQHKGYKCCYMEELNHGNSTN